MPVRPPTFRPRSARSRREAGSEYDARRGSARDRGYSARWDAAASAFRREHPLCLGCWAVGKVVACELVDHVVPHKGNMVVFWDRSRWQSACAWHHDVVKQKLEALYARGEIDEAGLWLSSQKAQELTLNP